MIHVTPHLADDDLILAFYGELPESDATVHLATCAECRQRLEELRTDLALVDLAVPAREENYGVWVWHRLRPRLGAGREIRRVAAVAAVAALILGAFAVGRYTAAPPTVDDTLAETKPAVRALRVSLGDHLERSHRVLAEIENTEDGVAEFAGERERAEALLTPNRLYREAARQAGDPNAADVLEDLERMLLEIVHSPDKVSREEFDDLRRQIRERGLMLRVKVIEEEYQEEPELELSQQ